MKKFVVDDEPDIRSLISLLEMGFVTIQAANAQKPVR